MATWRETFTRYQRALPHGATFKERGEATRRAAAEYRREHGGKRRGTRSNPSRSDIKKIAVVAGLGLAAYELMKNQKPAAQTQQAPTAGTVASASIGA